MEIRRTRGASPRRTPCRAIARSTGSPVDVAPDHHRVHDREDLRPAEVVALDRDVVLEQPPHRAGPRRERRRRARGVSASISPSASICASVCVGPIRVDADRRRQVELDLLVAPRLLDAAGEVLDARRIDAVLVLQDAADPDRRRHLVFGHADALAGEVLGSRMPLFAETKMHEWRKIRDGKTGIAMNGAIVAPQRHRVRRQRHLGHVEFAVPQHAEERLLDVELEILEVDAVGPHAAVGERARAVVVPAGQREAQARHGRFLR